MKVQELKNFKFSVEELQEYFNTVTRDFQHLKWTIDKIHNIVDYSDKWINLDDMYSWSIQSRYINYNKPETPYDMDEPVDFNIKVDSSWGGETELMFGFAKKILSKLPYARAMLISAIPPGGIINWHTDYEDDFNEETIKIHLPIQTNENAYFRFRDESFQLEVGKAYLTDVAYEHMIENKGNTDRIHLFFKIPVSKVPELLSLDIWI